MEVTSHITETIKDKDACAYHSIMSVVGLILTFAIYLLLIIIYVIIIYYKVRTKMWLSTQFMSYSFCKLTRAQKSR